MPLPACLEGVTEIGRDPGLCASAVLTDDTTVIPDTLMDPVAYSNPLVAGPMGVRFYAAQSTASFRSAARCSWVSLSRRVLVFETHTPSLTATGSV
ncbi:hypothetical protein ABZ135_37040, partial [Streptomyces sp. NPDC006339]